MLTCYREGYLLTCYREGYFDVYAPFALFNCRGDGFSRVLHHFCNALCVHVCVHVFMYVCMYVCMYACMKCMYECKYVRNVCMYVYVCMNMYVCVCVYTYTYACMYACMYLCMYVPMHACMHACTYVWFFPRLASLARSMYVPMYLINVMHLLAGCVCVVFNLCICAKVCVGLMCLYAYMHVFMHIFSPLFLPGVRRSSGCCPLLILTGQHSLKACLMPDLSCSTSGGALVAKLETSL